MLSKLLHVSTALWLCIEIGLFAKDRVPWGNSDFFWLMWTSSIVNLILVAICIELFRKLHATQTE